MSELDPDDEWVLIEDRINCLTKIAKRRYVENQHRKPWEKREPRWHIYKAIDQMSIASYHYRQENWVAYETNMADALNHMIMAMETTNNPKRGCHPILNEK